jgi:hypothetical protein
MEYLFLLLLIGAAAIGIPIYLKKRKANQQKSSVSMRRNKDEV